MKKLAIGAVKVSTVCAVLDAQWNGKTLKSGEGVE